MSDIVALPFLFSCSVEQHFRTERQVQAVLAVLLICISFEIAGNPFALVNERYKILGRLELSTLFVQWATMWCGSMIYASQDPDSKGFVVFLTVIVATMNLGMLVWLVLRLLGECVRIIYIYQTVAVFLWHFWPWEIHGFGILGNENTVWLPNLGCR